MVLAKNFAREPMTPASVERPASSRMLSLDVLRGITIAFMIMVNNNGMHALAV